MKYLILLLLLITVTGLHAQRKSAVKSQLKIEDVPDRPIDTVSTPDPETKIILFSNNTWTYYRPTLHSMDSLPVYTQHWDTTGVFAYKSIAYNDLPPVVELNLVSSLADFKAPITGKVYSKYGPRRSRNHNGVDIPIKLGEPIYATFDGKVRYAKFNTGGYGYLVIVRHPNGLETWHAHLSRLNVNVDDYVKCGQVIGFGGNTGRSRGVHLHFEMRYKDQTFDPEFIVDFETGNLRYQTFALEKSFFNIHSRASEILEEEDAYDIPLISSLSGEDTTSMDILERIQAAQEKNSSKQPSISQSNSIYHTVVKGDILGKLAIRYGVSIDQICRLNNITRKTTLQLKQKLRIK